MAESKPKMDVAAAVKDWHAGKRTLNSVVDAMVSAGYTKSEISRAVDRPYRQVFNTVNRGEYNKRPSERKKRS